MSVELDYLENASVTQDAQGIIVRRSGLLRSIGGPVTARARNALEAPGLPRYGEAHPVFGKLKVANITLTAVDTETWDVQLEYREPSTEEKAQNTPLGEVVEMSWFSTNVTVDVLYDAKGRRMFHWYAGKPTSLSVTGGRVREVRSLTTQLGVKAERADVQIPSIGVRVLMAEATDPRTRLDFVGKMNGNYWSGYPPKTWLFVGMVGNKERGRWLNTYELIYRSDTWTLRSDIEFNGAPPSDATVGNGIEFFDVYPEINFDKLGFSV